MRAPWFCDGPWRGLPKGLTFHQLLSTSSPKRPKITVDVIIAKIRLGKTTSYRWVSATQLSRADHKIYSCTIILDLDLKSLQMRRDMPDTRFKKVYTFNSARKSMSTIIPLDTGGFRWHTHECKKNLRETFPPARVYTKGASEIVMKKCSFLLSENGRVDSFTAHHQDRWWYFIYAFVRDIFCHCPVFF